ncbi:hypothetical protein LUZ60_002826 [Juncus effusus]|nr:hypothetical protein LUZ60_002826 [Juncus effusus]
MLTTQVVSESCACAESFPGAVRDGRWRSVMTFYRPIPLRGDQQHPPELPRDLLGLAFNDLPNEYFFVMRTQRLTMRADLSVQGVMDKLGSYKARFVVHFEGFQYKLGDFRLRIGKCINTPNDALRGVMMEVEYMPLSSIEKSKRIMEEFFDIWQEAIVKKNLAGHFINPDANFSEYGLNDHYTPQHTAVQYGVCIVQVMASNRSQ